jgi:hypothetical protein
LRGSVIPFISIRDLRNCILAGEVEAKANINQFHKNIEILKLLELKEKQFHENLKLIEEARKVIFCKYRRRRKFSTSSLFATHFDILTRKIRPRIMQNKATNCIRNQLYTSA